MISRSRQFLVLATIAAGLIPATTVQAQYDRFTYGRQPPPLYPYERQADQPKASPMTAKPHTARRPRKSNDSAPIEELRRRHPIKRAVVRTRRIVREKPIVTETRRIVDDPPRVIERRRYVDRAPASARVGRPARIANPAPRATTDGGKTKGRVIHADAEVTILGPDRMIIRLFRKKSRGSERSARAD